MKGADGVGTVDPENAGSQIKNHTTLRPWGTCILKTYYKCAKITFLFKNFIIQVSNKTTFYARPTEEEKTTFVTFPKKQDTDPDPGGKNEKSREIC